MDASNERYFAARVRKDLSALVPVELVVSSESTEFMGESMPMKTYLGNLVVNAMDDGLLAIPEARWLKDDFRLVVRDKGGFQNLVDSAGNHADVFDAAKLALHGLRGKGRAEARAVAVGGGTNLGAMSLPAAGPVPTLMV